MTLMQQLGWGSTYLMTCLLIETAILVACIASVQRVGSWLMERGQTVRHTIILLVSLMFILLSHTVQIWIWAVVFVWSGALPDWNTSIYFTLITFTSLGYGDIVLDEGLRIFGGFAAITGLLAFGISTAFVVAIVGRIFGISHYSALEQKD